MVDMVRIPQLKVSGAQVIVGRKAAKGQRARNQRK